jgi:hypothetical protein
MNHAALGSGLINSWLDLSVLTLSGVLLLWPSIKMHQRARVLGRREVKKQSRDQSALTPGCNGEYG